MKELFQSLIVGDWVAAAHLPSEYRDKDLLVKPTKKYMLVKYFWHLVIMKLHLHKFWRWTIFVPSKIL